MSTTEETLALEKAPKDEFLELVERFMGPDVSPEKLKEMMELKFKWDAQQAETSYDAAMIDAKRKVKALAWDKIGANGSRNVSYPKIHAMLEPIMEEHGFAMSFDTETDPRPNMMIMCCDVSHIEVMQDRRYVHKRRHRLPMPIDGKGPKDSGVMTGQQAVGSGTSYGMRYLAKLIWDIPMLVAIDDTDGAAVVALIDAAQKSNLEKMLKPFNEVRQKAFLKKFGIETLDQLPKSQYNKAINAINEVISREAKGGPVNAEQAATLTALIEEVGGDCRSEFLKAHQIKKVGDLPAGQYQSSLKALQEQRRGV